jgi:muramidase (phage lysozyme)
MSDAASLHGAGYGQPENSLGSLQQAFVREGGRVI